PPELLGNEAKPYQRPRPRRWGTRGDARLGPRPDRDSLRDTSASTLTGAPGVDTGEHRAGTMPGAARGERTRQVRRSAAMVAMGAMLFLAGCSAGGGSSSEAAAEAPAAQVSLAPADGSVDVSPVVP